HRVIQSFAIAALNCLHPQVETLVCPTRHLGPKSAARALEKVGPAHGVSLPQPPPGVSAGLLQIPPTRKHASERICKSLARTPSVRTKRRTKQGAPKYTRSQAGWHSSCPRTSQKPGSRV